MSDFWNLWVIVLTVTTLVLLCWLLFATRKSEKYKDPTENTMGHNFDGIEEYDNPLPMWWLTMFVLSIVFSVLYLIAYPGLGNFPGVLGWTSKGAWEKEIQQSKERYGPIFAKYASVSIEELAKDTKANKMGARIFSNNCALCHGSDARGTLGYPDLTDNDWLYGNSGAQIKQSITLGRNGVMPGWQQSLGDESVDQLTAHVLNISGAPHDAALAAKGKNVFANMCAACHQGDGKGNIQLGAPDLTDNIWLYGSNEANIRKSIADGRSGKMPAHAELINADKIHLLSAYVYSLASP